MTSDRKLISWLLATLFSIIFWFGFINPVMAIPACTDSKCGDDSFSQIPYIVNELQLTDSAGGVSTKNYSLLDTSKLSFSRFPPLNLTTDFLSQVQALSPDVAGQIAGQYGLTNLNGLTGKYGQISDLMPMSMALGALELPMQDIFNLSKQFGVGTVVDGILQPTANLPINLDSLGLNGQGISMLPIANIINGVPGLSELSLSKTPSITALAGVAGLGNISLDSNDFSSLTVGQALKLLPSLGSLPLNTLDPSQVISNFPQAAQEALNKLNITDLSQVSKFVPTNLFNFSGTGIIPGLDPSKLTLANFSTSSIPGLSTTPLSSIPGTEQLPISSIPGLKDIPVSKLPIPLVPQAGTKLGLVDVVFEKPEHKLPQPDHVISGTLPDSSNTLTKVLCTGDGCSGMEIHQLDAPDFKGYHWMDDAYTGPDGFGPACLPFGCKGPVGNHPYGLAARVAVSSPSEAKGRLQTKLYFHACWTILGVGYTCTPYALPAGGIPFITYNEKDAFLFLPPGNKVSGSDYNYPGYAPKSCGGSGGGGLVAGTPIDAGTLGELEKAAIDAAPASDRANAEQGIPLIMKACTDQGITDPAQLAYILATATIESDFHPRIENADTCYGSDSEGFCGRGYIQLTHRDAYQKTSERLGMGTQLVDNPDLVNDPAIAAKAICSVMGQGGITGDGKSISDHIPAGTPPDALFNAWYGSRHMINNDDPSDRGNPAAVAGTARIYYDALVAAQKKSPTPTSTPAPTSTPKPISSIPTVTSVCSSVPKSGDVKPYDGKPLDGWCDPLPIGIQTSPFGEYPHGSPPPHVHMGIDIAASRGSTVYATADGTVEETETECVEGVGQCGHGYGNYVAIRHTGAKAGFWSLYGHNDRPLVSVGQDVKCGQPIALEGSTGFSTGPHIHFEILTQPQSGQISPHSVGVPNMNS
jgi:hypothetical protein